MIIVVGILAFIVFVHWFSEKGSVDFQNTIDELNDQPPSRNYLLELALFLGAGAVLLVACVH